MPRPQHKNKAIIGLSPGGGELIDFYDGGDHIHIWGLKFRTEKHIWGLEFLRLKKTYLGSKIDSQSTYLGSEILRVKKELFEKEQIIM